MHQKRHRSRRKNGTWDWWSKHVKPIFAFLDRKLGQELKKVLMCQQRIQGGTWGPRPLLPPRIYQNYAVFRQFKGKNPYFKQILGSGTPWSQNSAGPSWLKSWIRACVSWAQILEAGATYLLNWNLVEIRTPVFHVHNHFLVSSTRSVFHCSCVLRNHLTPSPSRIGATTGGSQLIRKRINPNRCKSKVVWKSNLCLSCVNLHA